MPMMRVALHTIPDVAPMSLSVFLIWGVWDTIPVAMMLLFYWLYTARFGSRVGSGLAAGTLNWLFFFVLFWLELMNMRLAQLGARHCSSPRLARMRDCLRHRARMFSSLYSVRTQSIRLRQSPQYWQQVQYLRI
jgi:hypothetical protein